MPLRFAVCVEWATLPASSVIVTTEAYADGCAGAKLTPTVQLLPAATVDWLQWSLEKANADPPVLVTVVMCSAALPVLVTVRVADLLLPVLTVPKAMSLTLTAGVGTVAVPLSSETSLWVLPLSKATPIRAFRGPGRSHRRERDPQIA